MDNQKIKSGFVTIIGKPNVGKSTFINNCLGRKISIISNKPQTTRNSIQGIYNKDDVQIIFIDTPGIHKAHNELGRFMNKESFTTLKEVDLILYIVDGTKGKSAQDDFILKQFSKSDTPVYLVINKIDLVKDKNKLLEIVLEYTNEFTFKEVFYISALNGENVEKMLENITGVLDYGPRYYPLDQVSDHPETFIIAELVREKVLHLTHEEIPHSVGVVIESMTDDDRNKNLLNIRAIIYVERPSQKKIIIGKGGLMIKEIGTLAREEIVPLLGRKIYLDLFVKVLPNWRDKEQDIQRLGYK
ncbi:MAG TPA: GTPase Era [Acholeplasmataceae bacterium]|nr:GTPase Era [Acholeplasmataceae bacterium]